MECGAICQHYESNVEESRAKRGAAWVRFPSKGFSTGGNTLHSALRGTHVDPALNSCNLVQCCARQGLRKAKERADNHHNIRAAQNVELLHSRQYDHRSAVGVLPTGENGRIELIKERQVLVWSEI